MALVIWGAAALGAAWADPATDQYGDLFPVSGGNTPSSQLGRGDQVPSGAASTGAADGQTLAAIVEATTPSGARAGGSARHGESDSGPDTGSDMEPGSRSGPGGTSVVRLGAAITGGIGGLGVGFPLLLATVVGLMGGAWALSRATGRP